MVGGYRTDVLATAQAILAGPLATTCALQALREPVGVNVDAVVVNLACAIVDRVRELPPDPQEASA